MPPRVLPFREVRRRLLADGWIEAGTRGSHVKFVKHDSGGTRTVIVPKHSEVARGTLRTILRQAGLTPEEFDRL